jgi:hypothetical protein
MLVESVFFVEFGFGGFSKSRLIFIYLWEKTHHKTWIGISLWENTQPWIWVNKNYIGLIWP